jgi:uncharacterized repeat protein (TIGR02543 family)
LEAASGWLESAYVQWLPVQNAEKYNVYVSGEGLVNRKLDDQLIRSYGAYFRADALGLKAGSYTMRVVPVLSGQEGSGATTGTINVIAYDRTGFAFSNGRVPGAYKSDGTPKDNAVILYITENNKNTISLTVTGANSNPCIGLQAILDGFKKGNDTRPLIVRFVGQLTDPSYLLNGDLVVENKNNALSHITIEGVGEDAVADGWGIRIKNATNIEIRNVATMNCNSSEGDNISLQQNNDYIWVHNNDYFYGASGGDADQAKGDGALDCKKSTYVTFSYNHFWDSGKANLLGLSENSTTGWYITYHHNWFDHSDSRHPRVRYYSAHVYNNYYDGNSKYGVGSTLGSSVFVEANYFRNCNYPMLTSMQGSDVYNESTQANDYNNNPTFSKENGGTIKAFNNHMIGQRRFVPYGGNGFPNSTVDFDAYVATSRNETISSTVKSAYGQNTYNNFDTNPAIMYAYTPDSPEQARDKTMMYAGRMDGGDLKWTFNNAVDDISYDIIPGLKSALTNYQTSLVAIQGENSTTTFYQLTVNKTGNGTVLPASGSFQEGATVTLTATPDQGWTFSNWTGDAIGTATSLSLTMDANKTITANFTEFQGQYFTLTTNTSGQGTVNPTTGSYPYGTVVPITAIPATGWVFKNWSGGATGTSNPVNVTFNADKTITAVFEEVTTSAGDRIEDDDSRVRFAGNGSLKPYANADNGYAINLSNSAGRRITWQYTTSSFGEYQVTLRYTRKATMSSRGNLIVNGTSTEIAMAVTAGDAFTTSSFNVELVSGLNTVIFETLDGGESADIDWIEFAGGEEEEPISYLLSTSVVGSGTVNPNGGIFVEGTEVQITATPAANYTFGGWTGDVTSSSATITVTMTSDKTIVATFNEIPPVTYTLTTSVVGNGTVNPSVGTYDEGTNVEITATPSVNYIFTGWSGDISGTNATISVTMTSNKNIVAHFEEEEVILSTDGNDLFGIHPNPAGRMLHVQLHKSSVATHYQVVDMSGKMVKQGATNASQRLEVPVADLKPAVYIFRLRIDGEMKEMRFVKE